MKSVFLSIKEKHEYALEQLLQLLHKDTIDDKLNQNFSNLLFELGISYGNKNTFEKCNDYLKVQSSKYLESQKLLDQYWQYKIALNLNNNEFYKGEINLQNIEDCFKAYENKNFFDESIKFFCKECRQISKMISRQQKVVLFPKLLVLKLERFSISKHAKNVNLIQYHLQSLKFHQNEAFYNLYGVSCHSSSAMNCGHYFSYIKAIHDQKWYRVDDSVVSQCDDKKVTSSDAMVLFYHLQEPSSHI